MIYSSLGDRVGRKRKLKEIGLLEALKLCERGSCEFV